MSTPYTWLHIGLGSFHRAHQAWYFNQLMRNGDHSWQIAAGNIRNDSEATIETLQRQHGEYVLETVTPRGHRHHELIKSIKKLIPWQADLAPLISCGAEPNTKVIAFTVTESGYYLDTEFNLQINNPDIKQDLQGGNQTIYGTISKILEQRIEQQAGPVTLLSCDNVRHNGQRFRDGLIEFLNLTHNAKVLGWLADNVSFPNSMVDRITPKPEPNLTDRVLDKTGVHDGAPVMGESFIQWVLEDNFIAGRPKLEEVGVELVASVDPYEEAKIRILNVSHAGIAWTGALIGQKYIHESTQTGFIREIVYKYITRDVIPCLSQHQNDIDFYQYRDVVLDRFTNEHIKDTIQRVSGDGFSKIPAMITPTLVESYAQGRVPKATASLPAIFYVFMQEWHIGRLAFDYYDGILDSASVHQMYEADDPIHLYASNQSLFGELAQKPEFEALLRNRIEAVYALLS
ncbi:MULTISPECIES: D-arabinitol 4-dehydrogenase [Vibrio]|uniref:Mannitol dehydrogenase family protein n=2 Tax=Vibrio TaxID=662 RepID=A0A7X4RW84_9VIBR|nr:MULTISPECIES: D-arabinitol 4-dehydrogenase [Vibrio]MBF9003052.1 mannitol dehydrogenase family protein [Vibrio nitrifigilis]MZI95393.1 mannitol dehydrogenase family protein [Vibrio eleionomae]